MHRVVAIVLLGVGFAGGVAGLKAQAAAPPNTAAQFRQALTTSIPTYGHTPFHMVLKMAPDIANRPHARPAPDWMQGSMEVFWEAPNKYKLVLNSPLFSQTKIVEGTRIEERDAGDFYPRWLDNFVKALFDPTPQASMAKLATLPLRGGGSIVLPNSKTISMPRCAETMERPGGITEETTIARICLEASHPWYQGTLDFTRYVSFTDYERFGTQMVPRTWSDDIPENIFVEGSVTVLEPLSKADAAAIRVMTPTAPEAQMHTKFLSRKEIESHIETIPAFDWPAEDTEALEGYMIVYVRTDREGNIRESYWDSSDNYKLQDAGVQLALKSKLKPLLIDGAPVQMEGPLVLHFKTHRSVLASATQ